MCKWRSSDIWENCRIVSNLYSCKEMLEPKSVSNCVIMKGKKKGGRSITPPPFVRKTRTMQNPLT